MYSFKYLLLYQAISLMDQFQSDDHLGDALFCW